MSLDASLVSNGLFSPSGNNCRVHQRQVCDLATNCKPVSLEMKEVSWAATISDISLGGVRLHLKRRFEKGTPLAIALPGDHEHEPSTVFVKVVHVRPQTDGTWALGCKFVSELAEDVLQRLTSDDEAPTTQSLKQQETRSTSVPVQTTSIPIARVSSPATKILSNVYFQIEIHRGSQISCLWKRFDVSKCWPIIPGKVWRLSGSSTDCPPWSLKIQLLNCKQESDRWVFHARLLKSPKLPDLLRALAPR